MNQGTEWGLLMKKNRSQKSRASVPLTQCSLQNTKIHRFMRSMWAERGKLDGHVAAGYSPKTSSREMQPM
jgi:hypothetical protein